MALIIRNNFKEISADYCKAIWKQSSLLRQPRFVDRNLNYFNRLF